MSKQKTFTCGECNKTLASLRTLKLHEKIHSGHRPFQCSLCGKTFIRKDRLKEHVNSHNDNTVFECSECNSTFKIKDSLTRHIKKASVEKYYPCLLCEKGFSMACGLRKHKEICHVREKVYNCYYCTMKFSSKSNLARHIKVHTGEKNEKCSFCDEVFRTAGCLQRHEKIHSNEKPHECKVCHKRFTMKSYLTIHERIHTGVKPYKCSLCEKKFSHKSNLMVHDRSVHKAEKQFECSNCGKKFGTKKTLIRHEKVHSDVKPYVCSYCDASFKEPLNLQLHEDAIHKGKKPFVCSYCSKTFVTDSRLQRHQKLHTEKKMFECSHCDITFRLKSHLTQHIKQNHLLDSVSSESEKKLPSSPAARRSQRDIRNGRTLYAIDKDGSSSVDSFQSCKKEAILSPKEENGFQNVFGVEYIKCEYSSEGSWGTNRKIKICTEDIMYHQSGDRTPSQCRTSNETKQKTNDSTAMGNRCENDLSVHSNENKHFSDNIPSKECKQRAPVSSENNQSAKNLWRISKDRNIKRHQLVTSSKEFSAEDIHKVKTEKDDWRIFMPILIANLEACLNRYYTGSRNEKSSY